MQAAVRIPSLRNNLYTAAWFQDVRGSADGLRPTTEAACYDLMQVYSQTHKGCQLSGRSADLDDRAFTKTASGLDAATYKYPREENLPRGPKPQSAVDAIHRQRRHAHHRRQIAAEQQLSHLQPARLDHVGAAHHGKPQIHELERSVSAQPQPAYLPGLQLAEGAVGRLLPRLHRREALPAADRGGGEERSEGAGRSRA
ncbi:hypothetical protein SUNI508_12309 [Seiridium unicorne]|uniref:Uncharacterized protein n=1 Tax=Seiridium unicorne TaxID=138068 RepID=A0ABR2UEH3_9PEZI